MAFGQAAGPPARAKQMDELAELLDQRGFSSLREARHPFGLTQRQASGKFTVTEADEMIERLRAESVVRGEPGAEPTGSLAAVGQAPLGDQQDRAREEETAARLGAEVMATELTNRGWCCIPPG